MTADDLLRSRRHKLRLVIFDCDGVLVDSEPLANRVTAEMISEEGWSITPHEAERRFVGLNLEAMVPAIEAELGRSLRADWVPELTDRLITTLARESAPIPGAIAALDGVAALGLPWRVASNSSHGEMNAKFACIGLADRVAGRLHSYTDVPHGKPAPDLYLAAAAAEGIAAPHCLVVEDSVTGVRAAVAAGMDVLGYAPHGDGAALRAAGAALFTSMSDLPSLIMLAPR
jgi:HAD superfamily hydrolase (TIGR01509 family)